MTAETNRFCNEFAVQFKMDEHVAFLSFSSMRRNVSILFLLWSYRHQPLRYFLLHGIANELAALLKKNCIGTSARSVGGSDSRGMMT